MHGYKKCTKCGETKPLAEFFARKKGSKDGRMSCCKVCKTAAIYKWREDNKDKWNSYSREISMTPKAIERRKQYAQRQDVIERLRDSYKTEKYRAKKRLWRAANQNKLRHYYKDKNHRRRVAYRDGAVTEREWLGICAKYQHRCVYCYRKTKLTMDHEIPLSAGGTHTPSNIVPACQRCNASKQARHPIDYAQRFLGRLL